MPRGAILSASEISLCLYVILSVSEISLYLYVILSVSEISHDQSEENMPRQFFGGILHSYYSALNARALKLPFSAFFVKKCKCLMNIVARKPLQASLLARHWQDDVKKSTSY